MAFWDPTRPAYRANPYPSLARLREQDPVHWSAGYSAWVITRYEECAEVLRDSDRFTIDPCRTAGAWAEAIAEHRGSVPLGLSPTLGNTSGDPHRRLRHLVNPAFAPAAVHAAQSVIGGLVDELVCSLPASRPFDLMTALADPLPRRVMLVVMGFPPHEAARLQGLFATIETVRSNPRAAGKIAEARDAQRVATEFLEAHAGGGLPSESVLATLLSASRGGGPSLDDVVSLAVHIAAVGTGPTSGAIANAILALAEHPGVLSALREHPEGGRSTTHELLRYDSPTHIVPRFAAVDTLLAGRRIHRGDSVFAMAGAANRDPAMFAAPDVLDISRDARRQLGFGRGEHICLGGPLALAIIETALAAIVDRFGRLQVLGPPDYAPNVELRIPDRLMLQAS